MSDAPPVQILDVHEMEPPEPLTAILSALEQLPHGSLLKVRHRRDPLPLYPLLTEMGYAHRCLEKAPDEYRIYLWRSAENGLETACQADIARERQP